MAGPQIELYRNGKLGVLSSVLKKGNLNSAMAMRVRSGHKVVLLYFASIGKLW